MKNYVAFDVVESARVAEGKDVVRLARRAGRALLWTAAALLAVAAMGWAGRSDYEDATLCEMKNNGAYYELQRSHPGASEAELVKLYEDGLRR